MTCRSPGDSRPKCSLPKANSRFYLQQLEMSNQRLCNHASLILLKSLLWAGLTLLDVFWSVVVEKRLQLQSKDDRCEITTSSRAADVRSL